MTKTQIIDEREVTVSTWMKAGVGDYTVYENKLWYIMSMRMINLKPRFGLSREKESIICYPPIETILYKVVNPTGYIDI